MSGVESVKHPLYIQRGTILSWSLAEHTFRRHMPRQYFCFPSFLQFVVWECVL